MARANAVLTWCFRAIWRNDPALRRIESLKGSQTGRAKAAVPVFFTQKTTLA